MIGARFYSQLDATHLRNDVLEHALSRVSHANSRTVSHSFHTPHIFLWSQLFKHNELINRVFNPFYPLT